MYENNIFDLQGIPSQTEKSNLALIEGRQDISDILYSMAIFYKNKLTYQNGPIFS